MLPFKLQTSGHHHFRNLHDTIKSISLKQKRDSIKENAIFIVFEKHFNKQQLFFIL